jgi:hypothetical protein
MWWTTGRALYTRPCESEPVRLVDFRKLMGTLYGRGLHSSTPHINMSRLCH